MPFKQRLQQAAVLLRTRWSVGGLGSLFAVIAVTVAEFRIITFVYRFGIEALAKVAVDITHGMAWWKAFQNKLLGPYLLTTVFAPLFGSVSSGYYFFLLTTLLAANIAFFLLMRRRTQDTRKAFLYTIGFIALFVACLDPSWLYTWDTLDLLLFTLFAFGVFNGKGALYMAVLFFVALFNREDALFIALWLVIDAFGNEKGKPLFGVYLQDAKKAVLGIFLLAYGMIYTSFIRTALWIHGASDPSTSFLGNKLALTASLKELLYHNLFNMNIIVTVFVFALAGYFYRRRRLLDFRGYQVLALVAAIFAGTMVFGLVNETRCFFTLLPFIVLFHQSFSERRVETSIIKS